jgi:aarF domain-containing kinase
MSGKRLVDFAALFGAARRVAQNHAALRSRQLDVFNETSSVSKAVKHQTERITLTAKALGELTSKLEGAPAWMQQAQPSAAEYQRENRTPEQPRGQPKEGIEQDYFYRTPAGSTQKPLEKDGLKVRQEEPQLDEGLSGGTIPLAGSGIKTEQPINQDIYPEKHNSESLKKPLDGGAGPESIAPRSSSLSTVPDPDNVPSPQSATPTNPSSERSRILQRHSEKQIPSMAAHGPQSSDFRLSEGLDADVYYSPSHETSHTLSGLPRSKIPKLSESTQGDGTDGINSDVFYKSRVSEAMSEGADQPQDEEINTAVFHSARVARKLGGRTISEPKRLKHEETLPAKTPEVDDDIAGLAADITKVADASTLESEAPRPYELHESRVPSSRLGRLWEYGSLASGMAMGAIGETFRRATGSSDTGSVMLSAANMERLVGKLSRMRGAALKLGQMMSFQGKLEVSTIIRAC